MPIEYLSCTGVVQTTKVEEPAPETGLGFFDSSQLHRRRSLSLSRYSPLFISSPIPFRNRCQLNSAEAFARSTGETLLATSLARAHKTLLATSPQYEDSIQEKCGGLKRTMEKASNGRGGLNGSFFRRALAAEFRHELILLQGGPAANQFQQLIF